MTDTEFAAKETEILLTIPKEFHGVLSYYAYEKQHSGGYEEVLSCLSGIVFDLKKSIENFEARIRAEKQG